jgi:hypothetical protein
MASLGVDSATKSIKPGFSTVTALEAIPHSSLPQYNAGEQEVLIKVERLLVKRHWPTGKGK